MVFTLGFPTGRDSATFWDSGTGKTFLFRDKGTTGQKFPHCPGTKGQRDRLKIRKTLKSTDTEINLRGFLSTN
jgi:hypothetical protein